MTNPIVIILIAIVLIRSQLRPKPLRSRLFTFPALLLAYGVYIACQAQVQTGEALSLLLVTALGGAVGLLQGRLVRVYEEGRIWWVAGSWLTLAVWLLSIPIRFAVKYGFVELFHIHPQLTGRDAFVPFLFSIGGILLGKVCMIAIRYPGQMKAAAQGSNGGRRSRFKLS
jgi:hypothetical protein